jgi:hypothetical protein
MSRYITLQDLEASHRTLLANIRKLYLESQSNPITLEYVRSNEACRMLRISENTLRALRRQKALPFRKVGNAVYYHINDLRQLLEAKQDFERQNR